MGEKITSLDDAHHAKFGDGSELFLRNSHLASIEENSTRRILLQCMSGILSSLCDRIPDSAVGIIGNY